MIVVPIDKKKFQDIMNANLINGFVLPVNDKIIKFDKAIVYGFKRNGIIDNKLCSIDVKQIEELVKRQEFIKKSSLPLGIVTVDSVVVGVIYKRFYDYKNFNSLSDESSDLIVNNLRRAIYNNIELMENGIYNVDFTNNNILYSGEDVQLIDLDGKYIKMNGYATINDVYSFFLSDMFKIITRRIICDYNNDDVLRIYTELVPLFNPKGSLEYDYPLEVIEKIEMMRVLKKEN